MCRLCYVAIYDRKHLPARRGRENANQMGEFWWTSSIVDRRAIWINDGLIEEMNFYPPSSSSCSCSLRPNIYAEYTVTFTKNATWVLRSLFSAQYFILTKTNKGQVFDIFLLTNIVSQYDFWIITIFTSLELALKMVNFWIFLFWGLVWPGKFCPRQNMIKR
jgi:hypothetical protein